MRMRPRRRSLFVRFLWTASTVGLALLTAWEFEWPPFHNGKFKIPFLSKTEPQTKAETPAKDSAVAALDTHIQHKSDAADHEAHLAADDGAFMDPAARAAGTRLPERPLKSSQRWEPVPDAEMPGRFTTVGDVPSNTPHKRAADEEFDKSFHIDSSEEAKANSFDGGQWKTLPPAPTYTKTAPRARSNDAGVIQAAGQQTEPLDDFQSAPGTNAGKSGSSIGAADRKKASLGSPVTIGSDVPDFDEPAANRTTTNAHFEDDRAFPGDEPGGIRQTSVSSEVDALSPRLSPLTPEIEAANAQIRAGKLLEAHRILSRIYWSNPELRGQIAQGIKRTADSIYFAAQPHYMEPYVVESGDQLQRIAGKYQVPWEYLARLNEVDPHRIRAGRELKVIKGPFSAVVELGDFSLTVHAHGYYVRRYPVGIGRDGATPEGTFRVVNKVVNPQYTDPDGRVFDGDDPANPLGERWIDLGSGYGIHGTINPKSIGKAESRGCVRLTNADVEEVFDMLSLGSEVTIRR